MALRFMDDESRVIVPHEGLGGDSHDLSGRRGSVIVPHEGLGGDDFAVSDRDRVRDRSP